MLNGPDRVILTNRVEIRSLAMTCFDFSVNISPVFQTQSHPSGLRTDLKLKNPKESHLFNKKYK